MATSATDRAIEAVARWEKAGKLVRRVVIDGKRIEVEFGGEAKPESPDTVDWK